MNDDEFWEFRQFPLCRYVVIITLFVPMFINNNLLLPSASCGDRKLQKRFFHELVFEGRFMLDVPSTYFTEKLGAARTQLTCKLGELLSMISHCGKSKVSTQSILVSNFKSIEEMFG